MKRLAKLTGCVAAMAMFAALVLPTLAQADDQDVIDYRQHIMNTMDAQTAALGQILSTVIPDDNVVAHLEVIAIASQQSLSSFEKKVLGGESLPEVWENWEDFSAKMNDFSEKITTAAQVAKEKGKDAAMGRIMGHIMKASGGSADAGKVRGRLIERLR